MKVIYLFVAIIASFFSFSYVQSGVADEYTVAAAAFSSIFTDTFQFKALGKQDASEDIRQLVNKILCKLHVSGQRDIQVKSMSDLLRSVIGSENCMATHNAIFVDEEWLQSMTEYERTFVLAHEVMHIKNKDTLRSIGFCCGNGAAVAGLAKLCKDSQYRLAAMTAFTVLFIVASTTFRRYLETAADAGAETVAPGAFQITCSDHKVDQPLAVRVWNSICSWFALYPEDRFVKKDTTSDCSTTATSTVSALHHK